MTTYLPISDDHTDAAASAGPSCGSSDSSDSVLERLSLQIRQLETSGRPTRETIASGSRAMDRCLPNGGYAYGSTIELLRSAPGCGATSIALMIARQAMGEGKYLVIVDERRQLYPATIAALGVLLERVIVLHPTNHTDAVWGLDQSLRCSAVGATIATLHRLDDRVARRLQLAAELGGGLGILIRDASIARQQPSWSDIQWLLHSSDQATPSATHHRDTRQFHMELLRCGGGLAGARLRIAIDANGQWTDDDEPQNGRGQHEHASAVHLAAQLAQPTRRRREIVG
jgi:protein ImuA